MYLIKSDSKSAPDMLTFMTFVDITTQYTLNLDCLDTVQEWSFHCKNGLSIAQIKPEIADLPYCTV